MKKVLRFIGVLLLLIVVAVVVLGLVAPKDFTIERSVVINAPKEVVADRMFHFKNFNNWNPWAKMDPHMKTEIVGTDGQEGTLYQWKGNDDVGSGEMLAKFVSEKEVQYAMNFKEPWESKADGYWRVEDVSTGKTKAIWGFSMQPSFPMNGIMMLFGNSMMGKDFDKGLANLKTYVESQPAASPVRVQ